MILRISYIIIELLVVISLISYFMHPIGNFILFVTFMHPTCHNNKIVQIIVSRTHLIKIAMLNPQDIGQIPLLAIQIALINIAINALLVRSLLSLLLVLVI